MSGSFDFIVKHVSDAIKPFGFKRKNLNFQRFKTDSIHMLQFQKSSKTTKDVVVFTVTLGIFFPILAEKMGEKMLHSSIGDCHWRQRIGFLLPDKQDKWWTIKSLEDAKSAETEVEKVLIQQGLPLLDQHTMPYMIQSWEKGISPGITEGLAKRYLESLKK